MASKVAREGGLDLALWDGPRIISIELLSSAIYRNFNQLQFLKCSIFDLILILYSTCTSKLNYFLFSLFHRYEQSFEEILEFENSELSDQIMSRFVFVTV